MRLVLIWLLLSAGNVAYHAISATPRWIEAFSTCWDQGVALLAVALWSIALTGNKHSPQGDQS